MPPPHPPHPPHTRHGGLPASQVLGFIDPERLDACLAQLVPDPADRAFVRRCLVGEGPLHHRGANYVLITLLGELLAQLPAAAPTPAAAAGVPVPMRLPPHLADALEAGHFPLSLPTAALQQLAGGDARRLEAMVDCLTDGPPQHALANVILVALCQRLQASLTPRD